MKRFLAGLCLAGCLLAAGNAMAAATYPSAARVDTSVFIDPEGSWVIVSVKSRYGFRLQGVVDITVNGTLYKTDPVDTTTDFTRAYRVNAPTGLSAACSVFRGLAVTVGDNTTPVLTEGCANWSNSPGILPGSFEPSPVYPVRPPVVSVPAAPLRRVSGATTFKR